MSKKIFVCMYVALLLVVQSHVFGQEFKKDCPPPMSHIDNDPANARLNLFRFIKKSIITGMNAHVEDITFQPQIVTDFLANLDKKYDGVRIYFALSDNKANAPYKKNTLYLILVPTDSSELTEEDKTNMSDDDETNAYIISDEKFDPVDLTEAKNHFVIRWINRYVNKITPRIESWIIKNYGISFNETHSLWYSKAVLDDLQIYLQCLKDSNKIDQVKIDFASWTLNSDDKNLSFKMDLIFEIDNGKVSKFLTLAETEILESFKQHPEFLKNINIKKHFLDGDYTDTGLPCPPYKCP